MHVSLIMTSNMKKKMSKWSCGIVFAQHTLKVTLSKKILYPSLQIRTLFTSNTNEDSLANL